MSKIKPQVKIFVFIISSIDFCSAWLIISWHVIFLSWIISLRMIVYWSTKNDCIELFYEKTSVVICFWCFFFSLFMDKFDKQMIDFLFDNVEHFPDKVDPVLVLAIQIFFRHKTSAFISFNEWISLSKILLWTSIMRMNSFFSFVNLLNLTSRFDEL